MGLPAPDREPFPLPTPCQRVLALNEQLGWLLYESVPGKIHLWSQPARAIVFQREGNYLAAKSDPEGLWLTLEASSHVELVRPLTGKSYGELLAHKTDSDPYFVTTSAFSPDGQFLVVGGCTENAARCSAQVFRVDGLLASSPPLTSNLTHDDGIRDLAFSRDSRILVTVGEDRLARTWDTHDWRPKGPVMQHSGEVWFASVSSDGTRLLTASQSRLGRTDVLRFWDLTTGQSLSSRCLVGGQITAIGHLPGRQEWAFEQRLDQLDMNPISQIYRQPLVDAQIEDLRNTARATMGFDMDESGGLSPIPLEVQRASFERVRARQLAPPPKAVLSAP